MGITDAAIEAELSAMGAVTISTTASRQVLGSMNDFASLLEAYLPHEGTLMQAALKLAKAPCSPIGMNSPVAATLELMGVRPLTIETN